MRRGWFGEHMIWLGRFRIVLRVVGAIVRRELRAQLRSRSFVVQSLLLPLVLTALIGTALGGSREQDRASVVLVSANDDISVGLARALRESGLAQVAMLPLTAAGKEGVSPADLERARGYVRQGRGVAAIVLPPKLVSQLRVSPGRLPAVQIFTDPLSIVRAKAVVAVTKDYFATLKVARAAVLGAVTAAAPADAPALARSIEEVGGVVARRIESPSVAFTLGNPDRTGGYLAYYAVAFGVMFTFLTSAWAANGVIDEEERGTLHRLRAAPVGMFTLVIAKFFALVCTAALQLGFFAFTTSVFYGVYWGAFFPLSLAICAVALVSAGFGIIIAGFARSHEAVNMLALVVVLLSSLLGGSIWPIDGMPQVMAFISRLTPNRWAIEAFQGVAAEGLSLLGVWLPLVALSAFALFAIVLGTWRLRKRYA